MEVKLFVQLVAFGVRDIVISPITARVPSLAAFKNQTSLVSFRLLDLRSKCSNDLSSRT